MAPFDGFAHQLFDDGDLGYLCNAAIQLKFGYRRHSCGDQRKVPPSFLISFLDSGLEKCLLLRYYYMRYAAHFIVATVPRHRARHHESRSSSLPTSGCCAPATATTGDWKLGAMTTTPASNATDAWALTPSARKIILP